MNSIMEQALAADGEIARASMKNGHGLPVDPFLAIYMGAFEDPALENPAQDEEE